MLSTKDLETLKKRNVTPAEIDVQLKHFADGFPYLKLAGSANLQQGITAADDALAQAAADRWERFLADGGTVCKFVPASGAASRMFKALLAFVNSSEPTPAAGSPVAEVIDRIAEMPFAVELDNRLRELHGMDAKSLIAAGRQKDVIAGIVKPEGLNYGQLPKGLLSFHTYPDGVRTPLEEQLVEGAQTAASDGVARIHFTVSANHRKLFEEKLKAVQPVLEQKTGVRFEVSMSEQKPATDTVAVNPDNTLFRDDDGNMVFRPGGHGALISNLADIDAQVVFIKNIDNVVPDSQRADTIKYKKIIAGILMLAHDSIERFSKLMADGNVSDADIADMRRFVENTLCISHHGLDTMTRDEQLKWYAAKFDRPLRVCGMVRNEGEPGGGPYLAFNADGTASPQILESTQINTADPESMAMMNTATHFNPVDLVCNISDLRGKTYNLPDFVDRSTGFISEKSFAGRTLRALELPGLWNGAMSDWNTIFVEVPVSTFNPVKTVNDLLRPVHRNV